MGYDMTMIKPVQTGSDDSYFRLNIWGMGMAREVMQQAGMLDFTSPRPDWDSLSRPPGEAHDCDEPDLPQEWVDYFAACDRLLESHNSETPGIPWFKLCSNDGWRVLPSECRSAVAIWRHMAKEDQEMAISLGVNLQITEEESWPLGRGEPSTAEQRQERVLQVMEWFDEWIDYLERAADSGGFEVW